MTQHFDVNDPRLTAYALGEADDLELAAAIADDPELAAELASIRQAAGLLTETYHREPAEVLSEEQRAAVLGRDGSSDSEVETCDNTEPQLIEPPRGFWTPRRAIAALSGIAAVVAIAWLLQPVPLSSCEWCSRKGDSAPRVLALADGLETWRNSGPRGSRIESVFRGRGAVRRRLWRSRRPPGCLRVISLAVSLRQREE